MDLLFGAMNLGLICTFLVVGICLTYRIYDFADITVEGSFTLGGAVTAVLILDGIHPVLATFFGALAGAVSGMLTGLIHTQFKINGLLAGIIVMTGLYSINLHVMAKSNIPLMSLTTVVSILNDMNPGIHSEVWMFMIFLPLIALFMFFFALFLKTDIGLTIRATGNNQVMVAANGVNVNAMKVLGISVSNGLVAFSGGLLAQYQGFADIGMGVGVFVFGLASVIIGEAIFRRSQIWKMVLGLFMGSLIFRLMVALALYIGLNPIDLKLVTAAFVLATIIFSQKMRTRPKLTSKKILIPAVIIFLGILGIFVAPFIKSYFVQKHNYTIAVVLFNESDILVITKDSMIKRLNELGYHDKENTKVIVKTANSDMGMLNTIIDELKVSKPDVFVTISSQATQAVYNKVKDIPVVFATVANPFILGIGKSDTEHPSHVTGVYGSFPADGMLDIVEKILEGTVRIGEIWNPGLANTVFSINVLKNELNKRPNFMFEGVTVSSSNEVLQAATLLASKIDAFVLVPDVIVFEAFSSIASTAKKRKIPIFSSDIEKLKEGSFIVYGYTYKQSGIQAAELVHRVLNGERGIPFERYKKLILGINLDVAKELGINIPESVLKKANQIVENGALKEYDMEQSSLPLTQMTKMRRVALFMFTNNSILDTTAKGIMDELQRDSFDKRTGIEITELNAQGDNTLANTLVKKIIDSQYDFIITVSTLALQAVAHNNRSIPHVFCTVTDPVEAGVVKSFQDHPHYLTGIATPQPVESTIKIMRSIFPSAKRIGIVWDTSQVNSEYCTKKARKASISYGFELIEKTVSNVNEVDTAVKSLISEKIDIMFTSGDITVISVIPSIAKLMEKYKIPYITNNPADIGAGVFGALGADYYEVGTRAAGMLKELINGKKAVDLNIENYVPERLHINIELAKKFGIVIPKSILDQASTK
ncbi:MAG: hypothetical protein HQK79_17700 [Desulfobacterales bacterium]|nr:hypothetical protein [Desulfobacterales bacterium]